MIIVALEIVSAVRFVIVALETGTAGIGYCLQRLHKQQTFVKYCLFELLQSIFPDNL